MSHTVAVLGTKTTCVRLIEALHAAGTELSAVVTIDDSADTRSTLGTILSLGDDHSIPTFVAKSTSEAYETLLQSGASVVLVAGWYRIIPHGVLESVPNGWVGVHYSALPAYRGSAPVVWAVINGEVEIGYSIFRMTTGMDEGPIAGRGSVEVDETMYVADVLDALDAKSLAHLSSIAGAIADGTHEFVEQPTVGASYSGARNPSDGRIDWSLPAAAIARRVRAQSRPYPGAHSSFEDHQVTIWRATEEPDAAYFGQPGQVVRMIGDRPVVACGGGTGLVLDEVEPAVARYSLLTSRFGADTSTRATP